MAPTAAHQVGSAPGRLLLQYSGGYVDPSEIGPVPKLVALGLLLVIAAVVVTFIGWLAYRTKVERDSLEAAREEAPEPTEL